VPKKSQIVIFSSILVIGLGWLAYQAFHTREIEIINESDPKIQKADSKIPLSLKISEEALKNAKEHGAITDSQKVVENEEDNFEVFDRVEKAWLQKVGGIIGEDKYPLYLDMRDRNEKEKMQAYKEYHDYLRQKYGDKFSYNISDDQSIREKKINQRYLKDLLKLIGPEKFKAYTQTKDQLNEEIRRSNKNAIQIEF